MLQNAICLMGPSSSLLDFPHPVVFFTSPFFFSLITSHSENVRLRRDPLSPILILSAHTKIAATG